MTVQSKRSPKILAQAAAVCGVGSHALGLGTLLFAIAVDAWALFMGVALFTALVSAVGVVAGIGSLLLRERSKADDGAWKHTLGFTLLAAAYLPMMLAIWVGLGFHR